MKKVVLFLSVLLSLHAVILGQKIQYSRQTVPSSFVDAMQLVTNVSGNHHLLCFTAGKRPKIYVFNKLLQLEDERELDVKLKENTDLRILPFANYYYLYMHFPQTAVRTILRIDGDGEMVDMTASLLATMDSAQIAKSSTIQLVNHSNTLYLLSHSYYDDVKLVNTKIVELSPDMKERNLTLASFPFNMRKENLLQTMLAKGKLLVLKTVRDEEKGSSLEIVKFDMNTGDVLWNSFNSGSHLYLNAAFRYFEKDSSLLLYSLIREPLGTMRPQRTVFVSRLNDSLQQTAPLNLLKTQFRNNAGTNFLYLDGTQPCWLTFSNGYGAVRRDGYRPNDINYYGFDDVNNSFSRFNNRRFSNYTINYNQPTAVRLTVLNEKLNTTKDSLVVNNGSFYELQPRPSAQVTINNNPYLVLIQNFSSKKKGLVMLHTDKKGELTTTPLPVYDRYDYNLSLLDATDDYFILPYTHKGDAGLLKITLTN